MPVVGVVGGHGTDGLFRLARVHIPITKRFASTKRFVFFGIGV